MKYKEIKQIIEENYPKAGSPDKLLEILIRKKVLNLSDKEIPEHLLPGMPMEMKEEMTADIIRLYGTNSQGEVVGDEITIRGAISCTLDYIHRHYATIPRDYVRALKQR